MRKWTATFNGCKRGAIGTTYAIRTQCEGDDETAATADLYTRYDHIMHLQLVRNSEIDSAAPVESRQRGSNS